MQDAQGRRRRELCTRLGDHKLIRFIVAEPLLPLTVVDGVNQQSRTWRVERFLFEEHSRFAGKLGNKSMYSALQHCIPGSRERNRKRLIDGQSPDAKLHRSWHGQEIGRTLRLCLGMRSKKKRGTGD